MTDAQAPEPAVQGSDGGQLLRPGQAFFPAAARTEVA